jgi:hypothetical protein
VWFQTANHRPWDVLTALQLRSYQTLIERYADAASAVSRSFNTTPPEKRRESVGNPEKATDLQEMFKEKFADSDTTTDADGADSD